MGIVNLLGTANVLGHGDPNHDKGIGQEVSNIIVSGNVEDLRETARRLPDLKFSRYPGDWDRSQIHTPIASAVLHDKMDCFNFLINKRVVLEEPLILGFRNGGRKNGTVLSLAVRIIHLLGFQALRYAELLCKNGAQVQADLVSTEQPLAVLMQSIDTIADPQLFNRAIEVACLFVSILQHNNEINSICKDGFGYIHDINLHPFVLKMLLAAGANTDLRTRDTSRTPLHALLYAKHAPELLRILIEECGCDVNLLDNSWNALQRILHRVQQKNLYDPTWEKTIQLLFDKKINVDFLVGKDAYFFSDLKSLRQFKKIRAYRVMPLVVWNLLQLGHSPQFLEDVDMNLLPMNNITEQIHEFLEEDRQQRAAAITSSAIFSVLPDDLIPFILDKSTAPYYRMHHQT